MTAPPPLPTTAASKALLEVHDLRVYFGKRTRPIRAVDGVSFEVARGETVGLVGESGCGKSTTARALVGLAPAHSGLVKVGSEHIDFAEGRYTNFFGAESTTRAAKRARRDSFDFVRRDMQMVFQDPYASLNPRMTVGDIVAEPLDVHRILDGQDRLLRIVELMLQVGLDPKFLNRYPHEFSGGQRQRIGIARALALDPQVLLLDEPVSALDVSIQAQVLNLLSELREERGLGYLFIAHDLSVVRHLCDRVAVMYLGKIVEVANKSELFESPKHPYTKALLSAVPVPDPIVERSRQRILLEGDPPSPDREPIGCAFADRCPQVTDRCRQETPVLDHVDPLGALADVNGPMVACFEV